MLLANAADYHTQRTTARGDSARTILQHKQVKRQFVAFIEARLGHPPTLSDLTVDAATNWQIHLRERGLSNSTISSYTIVIRGWAKWLANDMSEAFPNGHPLVKLVAPPPDKTQPLTMSADQIKTLVAFCSQTQNPRRNAAIMLLLYDSGLRNDELCNVRLEDIELASKGEPGTLRVKLGKGRKARPAGFGDETSRALALYVRQERAGDSEWLFTTREGLQMKTDTVREVYRTVRKRVPGLVIKPHPHAARHSFGKAQAAAGTSAFLLSRLMGHSSVKMTERYIALSETDIATAFTSVVDRDAKRKGGRS